MAFDRWKIQYNPPKTVPSPVPETGTVVPALGMDAEGSSGVTSRAGDIIQKLDDLLATNSYLQDVILARTGAIGIEIDPATDPDTASALERFYASEPPNTVTVAMYSRVLDVEIGALQLEMALGPNSQYEANGFQMAAAQQIAKTVEIHLIDTGQFKYQLPLLLRNLKGDAVVFNAMKQHLASEFPTTTVRQTIENTIINGRNQAARDSIELSEPLYDWLDEVTEGFSKIYSSVYKLSATVSNVERHITQILDTYFYQPVEDIIRMVSIFRALRGIVHATRMKSIQQSLSGLVYVRLMSELVQVHFYMDKLMQMAITPIRSMIGNLGRLLAQVQAMGSAVGRVQSEISGIKEGFEHTQGALSGMSFGYDCGMPHNADMKKPPAKPIEIPGIKEAAGKLNSAQDTLNSTVQSVDSTVRKKENELLREAMTSLGCHLDWGVREGSRKAESVKEASEKLAQRRLSDTGQQLDIMCSMQALDLFTSLGEAVVRAHKSGAATTASTSQQKTEAVGKILDSLQTGTKFALQDGELQPTPPEVPPVPPRVESVFRRGGLDRLTDKDIRRVKGVLL